MLTSLDIRNIVLIDRLTLEGKSGLCAMTGETGAGKSILLDALSLALGERAETGLVRHGAEQASVTATFDLPPKHPALALLRDKDIATDGALILRRVLGKDGRSKAFINDMAVSVQLLKDLSAHLVEVHGQFETHGLLNPETHLSLLDLFGGTGDAARSVAQAWQTFRRAADELDAARKNIDSTRLQEEYLRHAVDELERLNPEAGEEEQLAERRKFFQAREKLGTALQDAAEALEGDGGILDKTGRISALLDRLSAIAGTRLTPVLEAAARMKAEAEELAHGIARLQNEDGGHDDAGAVEERYFALKDCAKKHRVTVDELPRVRDELAARLRLITHEEEALAELEEAMKESNLAFRAAAKTLSARRAKAAALLTKAVNAELPALKLEKAALMTDCITDAEHPGAHGFDRVQFLIKTNSQTPPGPLHKVASGGELARFMLALKVVLAKTSAATTLVFDEVDSGIGGATADAVGERLARLAQDYQVLVVTHSPQVAARADHHWIVSKSDKKDGTVTTVTPLNAAKERQEEIARMLSGAKITAEARAAAAKLLESHAA